jgi:hypothetical protein
MLYNKPRHLLWLSRIVRYLLTRSPASRFWNRILHFFNSLWPLLKRKPLDERNCSKSWPPSDSDVRSICNDREAIYTSTDPMYKLADFSTFPLGRDGSTPSTSSGPPQRPIFPLQERTPSVSRENDTNPEPSAPPENRSQVRSTNPERFSPPQTRPTDKMLDAIGSDFPTATNWNQSTSPLYAKPSIEPISASAFKRYERNIVMYVPTALL